MSSDRSALALERLAPSHPSPASGGGSGWGDRPPAAAPVGDLAELAAALARVEALVAAGADASPDAAAALERIADIAFVLHEREVEPSLCDALDAAMRDISEANARNRANAQRAHEAAELLRSLARRLDAMMAAQAQPQASRPVDVSPAASGLHGLAHGAELECADEFPAPARLFDAELAEDDPFAHTVAALAEALPEHAAAAPARVADEMAAAVTGTGQERAPDESVTATSAAVPASGSAAFASLASSAEAAAAASPVEMHQSINPDEDPGDLFEPMPGMRPASDAPAPAMSANVVQEAAPAANVTAQSPRGPAGAPVHAAARPAASDPLAPIRALSEEELIALFS